MKLNFIFSILLLLAISGFSQNAEIIDMAKLEDIISEEKNEIKVIKKKN